MLNYRRTKEQKLHDAGDWEQLFKELLKAREKNLLEDLKLSRSLTNLQSEWNLKDKSMFNEIFEQKRLVYRYNHEILQLRKEKHRQKQLSRARKRLNRPKSRIRRIESENNGDPDVNGTEIDQVKELNQPSLVFTEEESGSTQISPVKFIEPDLQDENPQAIPLQFSNILETVTHRHSIPSEKTDWTQLKFPDITKSKTDPRYSRSLHSRSASTSQPLSSHSVEDFGSEDDVKDTIVLKDYWVGDPKAIGSVRRPRVAPEEMTARSKASGEVRKYIRDLPKYPSCSKNCNHPGVCLDSQTLSSDLMPIVEKSKLLKEYKKMARHRDRQESEIPKVPIEMLARVTKGDLEMKSLRGLQQETMEKFNNAVTRSVLTSNDKVTVDVNKSMRIQVGYNYRPTVALQRSYTSSAI